MDSDLASYLAQLAARGETAHPKDFEPNKCTSTLHHYQFFRHVSELTGPPAEPRMAGARRDAASPELLARDAQERLLPQMREHRSCICPVYGVDDWGFERNGWQELVIRDVQQPVTAMLDSAVGRADVATQVEVLLCWEAVIDGMNANRSSSLDLGALGWRYGVARLVRQVGRDEPGENVNAVEQLIADLLDTQRVQEDFRRHHLAERSRLIYALERHNRIDTPEKLLTRARAQDTAIESERNALRKTWKAQSCAVRLPFAAIGRESAPALRRDDQDGCLLRAAVAYRRLLATALAIRLAQRDGEAVEDLPSPRSKYLPTMPADPFAREAGPLKLKRSGADWTVYSVGFDQVDSGGAGTDVAGDWLWRNSSGPDNLYITGRTR